MEDENSGKMLETQLTDETETKAVETGLEPTIEETELEPTIENNDVKTFTEQEMNEIVRKRLDRQKNKLHQQLGVENDDEITALIEKVKNG
jgi:E3 ubiquitin-protein ligase DOA10